MTLPAHCLTNRFEDVENACQTKFNETYITASEMCERLKITRTSLLQARRRGQLPNPIDVCQQRIFVWERKAVEPYLDAWEQILKIRREPNSV